MFVNSPAAQMLAGLGVIGGKKATAKAAAAAAAPAAATGSTAAPAEPVLDDAAVAAKRLERIFDAAESYLDADTRVAVAAALQQWAETSSEDLGDGETLADRLFALMVGIADDNKDGDLSDDETAVVQACLENAYDYMVSKGVTDADALAVLQDGDEDAANRVAEFLKGALPEGEDAEMDDVDNFAFDNDSSESLFDGVFDAVYKKKVVVRAGKKLRINKRVSGRVVLSAAQKVAIRKARRKAHSAVAKVRRAKSMKIRARAGI